MLTDFFWEQMLDEVIEELGSSQPVTEYCTEYEANYVKDNFEPRNLEITANKDVSMLYKGTCEVETARCRKVLVIKDAVTINYTVCLGD